MGNILRAAGIVPKTQCRQHTPFRDIQSVALPVLDRQRRRHLGGQPVQPERRESEQVEARCFGRVFVTRSGSRPARKRFWQKSLQFELTAAAGSLDSCSCDYLGAKELLCQSNLNAWRVPKFSSAIAATPIRTGLTPSRRSIRLWW